MAGYKSASFDPDEAAAASDLASAASDAASKASVALSAFGVQTITPADSVAINWSLGHIASLLLDRATTTISGFSGAVDGDRLILRVRQDGTGSRALVMPASVRYGTDITTLALPTGAGVTSYIGFIYHSADAKYDVVSVSRGFAP